MKFALWMDRFHNAAACDLDPLNPAASFFSRWNRDELRRLPPSTNIGAFDQSTGHSFEPGHPCVHLGIYEAPKDGISTVESTFSALLTAYDTQRRSKSRDTSRYLPLFRVMLDTMLRYADDPVGFTLVISPPPLPSIQLLNGSVRSSRYDFLRW